MKHHLHSAHPSSTVGQAGFTLVELITVVALIGILAAIALPSYRQYRTRVQSHQAAQDIAAMAASIKQFYLDGREYPADLAATGFGAQRDPWGQAYVYYNIDANGRGQARKDRALNPINSDFDLYSIGPDGATHTQVGNRQSDDDVLRANNGTYVGLGVDYGGR